MKGYVLNGVAVLVNRKASEIERNRNLSLANIPN